MAATYLLLNRIFICKKYKGRLFLNMNNKNFLETYFGVFAEPRTYLNFLYLIMSFPLGLAYFIFLVVGFSAGISTVIIWVGFLILALIFPAVWLLIRFERAQTIFLLGFDLPPMSTPVQPDASLWSRIKAFLINPVTWKGILFLLIKFPFGVFAFTMVTTGLAVGLGFILTPFIYPFATVNLGSYVVDNLSEALGVAIVGVMIIPGIVHIFNYFAQLAGRFSRYMLADEKYVTTGTHPSAMPTEIE